MKKNYYQWINEGQNQQKLQWMIKLNARISGTDINKGINPQKIEINTNNQLKIKTISNY